MSGIEELIVELCPDGVEYKALGDFATITRGGNFQKKDFTEIGIPCIHYGQIYMRYGLFTDRTITSINNEAAKKSKFATQNDIIMAVTSENVEDVCKSVAWLGSDDIAVSGHTAIISHQQNPKYLSYYFHSSMFFTQKVKLAHGTKVIEVTPDKLKNILIPIPPLAVQHEIVRILDNFTELTVELTTELTAELTARKKQYEYYRNILLSFNKERDVEVQWMTLGDVCENIASGNNKARNDSGEFPVYGSTGIIAHSDTYKYNEDLLLVARVGANAGFVHRATGQFDVSDNTLIVKPKSSYNITFAYYQLLNMRLNDLAVGGGQPLITAGKLKQIIIPVPSLEEQERIVSILSRFDVLTNDLTSSLPAEIEARRKQYEYYRDKLLTFKEVSA